MERILVVEDDKEIRTGIKYLLTENGFNIREAEDGNKALEILEKEKFDLIISDIMMPNKNGYELLTELQKNELLSAVPFLFLTAKTSYEDYRKGMNLGVDDYISKPFKASELLDAVKIRLSKKKSINAKFEELKTGITKYMPHELRTPLVSIIGFSDLILNEKDNNLSDEHFEMVDRINIAGNRLLRTIEKFLIYSELKSDSVLNPDNTKTIVPENFPISDVIKSVTLRLNKIYNNKIEIKELIEDASLRITERHFEMIMTELIDNALKFSDGDMPVIVSSQKLARSYIIKVVNRGKEFPKNQINKISEFVQFDREEFQQNGNGLGLQVVKTIAEMYGGSLEISSKNRSTKVTVKFLL